MHAHSGQLRAAAERLDARGILMLLVHEAAPSGPAGGLAACRDTLPDAPAYLVVSGDAVTDQDLDTLRGRYTDDQLFEIVVAAAFGKARDQLAAAHRALEEA